ncbi:MAG: serine/threonine-protein kinase, partial [Verrucomicrobiota bacterium]
MSQLKSDLIIDDRYQLIRKLGGGGMGEVWLVHDRTMQTDIAVKFLQGNLSSHPAMVDLLRQECLKGMNLKHPNIVSLYNFNCSDEQVYISMEYVQGGSLREYLDRQPGRRVSASETIRLGIRLCQAFSAAHHAQLIHRDIKPANILLRGDNLLDPRVIDFGISSAEDPDSPIGFLREGGTPSIMSPQQLDQQAPSPLDDIYSLGVLFFELLTGSRPWRGSDVAEQVRSGRAAPRVNERLSELGHPPVDEGLERLVESMLSKNPHRRPPSMSDVEARLGRNRIDPGQAVPGVVGGNMDDEEEKTQFDPSTPHHIAGAASAEAIAPLSEFEPPGSASRVGSTRRGNRWIAPMIAGAALLTAGVGVWLHLQDRPEK